MSQPSNLVNEEQIEKTKQMALGLYETNHTALRTEIANTLFSAFKDYLYGNTSTTYFANQVNKIISVEQRFHRYQEFFLYGPTQQYFIDNKNNLFKDFLNSNVGATYFYRHLNELEAVQRTLTPNLIITQLLRRTESSSTNSLENILINLCDQVMGSQNEKKLRGDISTERYYANKNNIQFAKSVIGRVKTQTTMFSFIDFNQSVFVDGATELKRQAGQAQKDEEIRQQQKAQKAAKRAEAVARIPKMIAHIFHISLHFLQHDLFSPSQSKSEAKNATTDPVHTAADKKLATHQLYLTLSADIDNQNELSYKVELQKLLGNVHKIFERDNVYQSLSSEQHFLLAKVYPEVIANIRQQCVLDQENFNLTGQHDALLPQVIKTFDDKIMTIFQEKLEQDQKQTKVLSQYLKAKI